MNNKEMIGKQTSITIFSFTAWDSRKSLKKKHFDKIDLDEITNKTYPMIGLVHLVCLEDLGFQMDLVDPK
jgi:sporulation-control protein spo0M